MNFLGPLLSLIAAIAQFFAKTKAPDPAAQTAAVANAEGQISAETARQTATDTQKEIAHVQDETAAAIDRLHDARSVSDERLVVEAAIRSANQAPGAN